MQTSGNLADIKKQTTTAQQLQITFCLRHTPLPPVACVASYLLHICCSHSLLLVFLPYSSPATLHCNSQFLLAKYFMQTYQPLGSQEIAALTPVRAVSPCEPSSRVRWTAESGQKVVKIPQSLGKVRVIMARLSEDCHTRSFLPSLQFNQLINFRCVPSNRQHLNNAENVKQSTNMNGVHYGKKINMLFLPQESEPESMYSSWNHVLVFFSWDYIFQLSMPSFSSNAEKQIHSPYSNFCRITYWA